MLRCQDDAECLFHPFVAERTQEKTAIRYLLSLEQMIENGYPIPSYLAETFEKPPGWVETKVEGSTETLLSPPSSEVPRIFAMDCEMVRTQPHMPCSPTDSGNSV